MDIAIRKRCIDSICLGSDFGRWGGSHAYVSTRVRGVVTCLLATLSFAIVSTLLANDFTLPIADEALVFEETGGVLAIESEHFFKQSKKDSRAWYVASAKNSLVLKPDPDLSHVAGASGGAYVEILPDTRTNHDEKLIQGENFTDKPGLMAVLNYKVYIHTPGRYYVWIRSYSTGAEDNGVHVGIDGTWPESGKRWQTVQKQKWAWECKQRTQEVHTGVPMQLFLDIEKAGDHEIMISMREDGFEMDKMVLSRNREFKPEGKGPAVQVKSGVLPERFPEVAEPLSEVKSIEEVAKKSVNVPVPSLTAKDFFENAQGYYLDKGKWLAINPEKNKQANARTWFPYPSGSYDVTLHVVGESDGQSTFQVAIGETKIGDFVAPLGTKVFEEGAQFSKTWKDVTVRKESQVIVSSQIASADGKEWSRARIALIEFVPADEATKLAIADVTIATSTAPKQVGPALEQPRGPDGKGDISVSGELKQWHKVTLTLDGPYAHEKDNQPNAFTDFALNVTFTHQSGSPTIKVPGYFAADGDAANSSAESGTRWRAHLSPDKTGTWNYTVSFTRGKHAALDGGGEALKPFDGVKGSFEIAPTDKSGRDFRAHGRLQYVGKRYLQFAGSHEYFFKAGPDSPETLLAYVDFDNTTGGKLDKAPLKTFEPHMADWMAGDPYWRNGKGKGLVGALNYLESKGLNAFSFLTYNASGDGDNVWPFIQRDAKLNYDCSKLDQWGIVFDHATNRGLYLHFKLQENEMDDNRLGPNRKDILVRESLDGGILGPERKLYCRELIARFGHALALNWNIGEENTQSSDEIRDMAKYLHDTDPYKHNIVVHTFPPQQDLVYKPLLGDKSLLTGVSLQNSWSNVHQRTLHWINQSTAAGRVWIVPNDEQNPASLGVPCDPGYKGHNGIALEKKPAGSAAEGFVSSKPYTLHDIRKLTLWGNLMAGGAGVEYYFGYQLPENDLVLQDFRSRDKSWDYCRIALEFLSANRIPLNDMVNADSLVGNKQNDNSKYCLSKRDEIYIVYLPDGGTTELDLKDARGEFSVSWFDPRNGGKLIASDVKQVQGGVTTTLGSPPKESDQDWVILVRK